MRLFTQVFGWDAKEVQVMLAKVRKIFEIRRYMPNMTCEFMRSFRTQLSGGIIANMVN